MVASMVRLSFDGEAGWLDTPMDEFRANNPDIFEDYPEFPACGRITFGGGSMPLGYLTVVTAP